MLATQTNTRGNVMTVASIYTCSYGDCTSNRAGKSKYCRAHAALARAAYLDRVAADKAERAERYEAFNRLTVEAHCAGIKAGEEAFPTPMVVVGGGQRYVVDEGACGFAWISVHPGNCSFAIWAKKNLGYTKAYGGGVQRWVHEFNQSITRKEAYARAYAEVLQDAGIKAYMGSRLD